ncbi:hypothetical protein [Pedobacter sp. ASV28]|uniref:hypothetical protein n=1 Tax=Pedobacter sp. ASV28 TaxID=2795123 RepID=UPI001E615CCF|nr:hypothetical protein [Pedobacter sp. ASV28]
MAQYNFFKGYVVTNEGDTLKGYVQGKESIVNPISIKYKTNTTAEVKLFSVKDSRAFGIGDKETYERHLVRISLGKIKLEDIPVGIDTSFRQEKVFLKVLHKGKHVSLYAYTDDIKTRFYVKEEGSLEPLELMNYSYYDPENTGKLVVSPRYRNQLQALFKKHEVSDKQDNLLYNIPYQSSDLVRVVSLINAEAPTKAKYPSSRFFMGAGAALNKTKYTGGHILANENSEAKSYASPYVVGGIDIYVDPAFGKMLVRIEAGFSRVKSEFYNEGSALSQGVRHKFEQNNFSLTTQLIHNFYNGENRKIYLGVGAAVYYAQTKQNEMEYSPSFGTAYKEKGAALEKTYLSIPFTIGAVFNKMIEASFSYVMPNKIINPVGYAIKMERFRLGLNYQFSL